MVFQSDDEKREGCPELTKGGASILFAVIELIVNKKQSKKVHY